MEKWAPSSLDVASTKEQVFELIGQGYRLCVEDDVCFMDEGYRDIGQDRPRIPVTRDAAEAALADKANGGLRAMTDEQVRKSIQVDPRNRKFYLMVM